MGALIALFDVPRYDTSGYFGWGGSRGASKRRYDVASFSNRF